MSTLVVPPPPKRWDALSFLSVALRLTLAPAAKVWLSPE